MNPEEGAFKLRGTNYKQETMAPLVSTCLSWIKIPPARPRNKRDDAGQAASILLASQRPNIGARIRPQGINTVF
jgi:hypothetical protein